MIPLVELDQLAAHQEIFIWGATARTHRLARLCRIVGPQKIEALICADDAPDFVSNEAPSLPLAKCLGILKNAGEGDIALLCDGPLPQDIQKQLAACAVTLYEARYTLNLFFPPCHTDHLLSDIAFKRMWHTMLARRGLAAAVRAQSDIPYNIKIDFDAVSRPPYAYAMQRAATEASMLGLTEISIVEFGVAGGNGLIALEEHASALENEFSIKFRLYGFDGGKGLPQPSDYRDQPYLFCEGDYPMDAAALRSRLTRTELILGDVKETTQHFWDEHDAPPLGAVLFDLDYYSSTMDAFQIFTAPRARHAPRVVCYFDDISWSPHVHDIAGELQAIHDFNNKEQDLKIVQSLNLDHMRVQPAPWNEQIFVLHDFRHCDYNRPLRAPNHRDRLDLMA